MRLLPRTRRGTWLLAVLVWAVGCTALWWAVPPRPRAEWALTPADQCMPVAFVPGRRAVLTYPLVAVGDSHVTRGPVRLWDADTGRVSELGSPDGLVNAVAVS